MDSRVSNKYTFSSLGLAIFLSTSGAFAQQPNSGNIETLQITGSRLDGQSIASVTTVNRAEIERINPLSTVELLARIPHVNITQNGQAGGLSFVSVRGGEANFTLIMIDGVAVNDPTNSRGGGFDFNQLDPAVIERVEVYRGGISAVHGGDAISGVIHFITRESSGQQVRLEVGNQKQRSASATLSFDNDHGLSVLANLSARHHNPSEFDKTDNQQAMLKMGWVTGGQNHQGFVSYSNSDNLAFAEDSGGLTYAMPQQAEARDSEQWLWGYRGQIPINETVILDLSASYLNREERSAHPGIADGVLSGIPASDITSEYEKSESEAYVSWQISPNWSALGGISLRQSTGSNRGFLDFGFPLPVDFELDLDTNSAFVETKYQSDSLLISVGARVDDPDQFDRETSYRVSAQWIVQQELTLFAVYNEGYKLPSFFALAHPLVGNPDLQPERSDNIELGMKHQTEELQWVITYFDNRFTDLVDFDDQLFTNVNRTQVDTQGVEVNGQWNITEWLLLLGDISYTDVDVVGEEQQLRRRPNWSGSLALQGQWNGLQVMIFVDFRDDYQDSSIATGQITLPGYAKYGASAQYEINDNLNLSLNIDNALGKTYQDAVGFKVDDQQVRAGLTYQF